MIRWLIVLSGTLVLAWYFVTISQSGPQVEPAPNVLLRGTNIYHGPYKSKEDCEKELAQYPSSVIARACKEEDDAGGS